MDSNDIPSVPTAPPPPPPFSPPPVIKPAAAPPRRGRGWMIFALVLLVLLGLSVLVNFTQLLSGLGPMSASHSRYGGPRLDETVLEDNDSANKIAVIDIDGIITSRAVDQGGNTMVDLIKEELNRAADDDRVKAVVLRVDSPGGEVLASDEISRAIANFEKGKKGAPGKPVIASMGDLAASGGYYVSTPCRWIVANELTLTGSIGVILHTWNYRGLMNKVGLQPEVYKSGRFKDMLSGERSPDEIPPEEHAMVQALIDETYNRFKTVVAQGRAAAHEQNKEEGRPLAADWQDYADGRVLSGSQAYNLGFVDELGDFEATVKRARTIAHISSANLIQYKQRYDLSDFLRIFGKSKAPVIKVDLGMDTPKLEAGQLYFLSPIFLH
jgi:protease IV